MAEGKDNAKAKAGSSDEGNENPWVTRFEGFFRAKMTKDIEKLAGDYPQKKSLEVDFREIERYDYELADEILKNIDYLIEAAGTAISTMDLPALEIEEFKPYIRIFNLPLDSQPLLREIGAKHINKVIAIEGVVKSMSDVLPKLKMAVWECKRCGNKYRIPQPQNRVAQPSMCECNHHEFKLVEDESMFADYQKIEVQEPLELLKGSEQATSLDIYLSNDIVNRIMPGDRARITGIVRLRPPLKGTGAVYGRYLEAIHCEETAKEFELVEVTKEEEEEIKKLAENPEIYKLLIKSIAPNVYGHEIVKEAITLQLFGGVKKTLPGDSKIRGNIHVLLVGEPGMAKSILLQKVNKIAPKSIYTAGKTTSGAGLSATAVKDEFGDGGWTLKAGALVLANGGFCMVDELDKMDPNDRSALHESMEQGSYHESFEIELAGRGKRKIGEFVEELFEKNKDKIIEGHKTLFLDLAKEDFSILSTDFEKIHEKKISQVSRHIAENDFLEFEFNNGRSIKVTDNHPMFVLRNGKISVIPAKEVTKKDVVPAPSKNPLKGEIQEICVPAITRNPALRFPSHNCGEFFRFLGYHITDGGYELNRGTKNGINFCNTRKELSDDYLGIVKKLFGCEPYIQYKGNQTIIRIISMDVLDYLESIDQKLICKGEEKRIPPQFLNSKTEDLSELMKAIFDGDGGFYYSRKIPRIKLVTPNREFAEQVQDLLLRFGIVSTIFLDRNYKKPIFRVDIPGKENLEKYAQGIGFTCIDKKQKLESYLKNSMMAKKIGKSIPSVSGKIIELMHALGIMHSKVTKGNLTKNNGFSRETLNQYVFALEEKLAILPHALTETEKSEDYAKLVDIRRTLGISQSKVAQHMKKGRALITYYEKKHPLFSASAYREALAKAIEDMISIENEVREVRKMVSGEQEWIKISKIRKVKRRNEKWVYDIGVEPEQCFVSGNLILHNSISVAKAGIITKFKTDTSVLAAANPKGSRFDPYQNFIEQIDLPASLLSRFDLFFIIRDVLDKKKDFEIATHILKSHQVGEALLQEKKGKKLTKKINDMEKEITPPIDADQLKKYVSYTRQNIFPIMNDESMKEIVEFYINLREEGRKQDAYAATHRQLEAMIRLSEASARIRLSNIVEKEDTDRALRIFKASLQEVAFDKETGRYDIDLITTGKSKAHTDNIKLVLRIVKEKAQLQDSVVIEDVLLEAEKDGLEKDKAREIISKLLRNGELYSPRTGVIKPAESK